MQTTSQHDGFKGLCDVVRRVLGQARALDVVAASKSTSHGILGVAEAMSDFIADVTMDVVGFWYKRSQLLRRMESARTIEEYWTLAHELDRLTVSAAHELGHTFDEMIQGAESWQHQSETSVYDFELIENRVTTFRRLMRDRQVPEIANLLRVDLHRNLGKHDHPMRFAS